MGKISVNLTADLVHASSADRTLTFQSGLAVLHGNFLGIGVIPFSATFDAIHFCH